MRILYPTLAVALLMFSRFEAVGQPQKQPAPPALPPINPAQAKLDITISGLDGPGLALASSDDPSIVAAGCENGSILYWDKDVLMGVRTGERPPSALKGHQGPVLALAWNGGPILASAGADQKVILWKMPDGKATHTIPVGSIVRSLAMAPGGKQLACSHDDLSIQLVDMAAGKLTTKLAGHTDWVLALAYSADGKRLASGGYDGTVRIWDAEGNKKVLDIPVQAVPPPKPPAPALPTVTVNSLAFSADGKTLAIGGADGLIYLFNPADGKLIRTLTGHASAVTALVFHANGTLLVSGSKDRSVRLWNLANGQPFKVLEGHTAWVQGVALLDQGTRVASVGADQTVRLWELKEPAKK